MHVYSQYTFNLGPNVTLNHLWSLAIEEQFYLLWPLLLFAARTPRRVLRLALVLSLFALLFRCLLLFRWGDAYAAHHTMPARADALLLGGVLAVFYRGPHWSSALRGAPAVCLGSAALVLISLVQATHSPFSSPYWTFCLRFSFVAIACCALLAWSLRPGFVARVFTMRPLRWLGKYSYGLYVLHLLFLPALSFRSRNALFALTHSKAIAAGVTGVGIFVLSALAAWLSFHLYEKRFLRLKRFFDYPPRPVSLT